MITKYKKQMMLSLVLIGTAVLGADNFYANIDDLHAYQKKNETCCYPKTTN